MKKLKNYVGASIGFVLVVSVMALSIPQTGHSTPTAADEGKDVRVTNTTAEAVPVAVQGAITVNGAVNISNTPTVDSRQNGDWNVGITGTPTVNVGNASSNPIPVRDVNNVPQAFMREVELIFSPNDASKSAEFPACPNNPNLCSNAVPQGKLMVVEYISANAFDPPGGKVLVYIESTGIGLKHYAVAMNPQISGFSVGSEETKLYFWPGEVLSGVARYDDLSGHPSSVTITISGYFVDLP